MNTPRELLAMTPEDIERYNRKSDHERRLQDIDRWYDRNSKACFAGRASK